MIYYDNYVLLCPKFSQIFDTTAAAAIIYLPNGMLNFAEKFSRTRPLLQNLQKSHFTEILDGIVINILISVMH